MPIYANEDYEAELIPEDDFVPAKLTKIEEKQISWTDKQTGKPKEAEILEWTFVVTSGAHEGKTVRGSCDPRLSNHENNRFRQWVEGVLGRDLAVGENIDTDDLIGLTADITVLHKDRGGTVYMNLADVVSSSPDDGTPF